MVVQGIKGVSQSQVEVELSQGAKFVIYQYCCSFLVVTAKDSSDVYYIRPGQSRLLKGLGFTVLSVLLGWWGIPWGPIYTVQTLWVNLRGGRDVTSVVKGQLPAVIEINNRPAPQRQMSPEQMRRKKIIGGAVTLVVVAWLLLSIYFQR